MLAKDIRRRAIAIADAVDPDEWLAFPGKSRRREDEVKIDDANIHLPIGYSGTIQERQVPVVARRNVFTGALPCFFTRRLVSTRHPLCPKLSVLRKTHVGTQDDKFDFVVFK